MAVSTLTILGVKAMTANYAALQTTGHNIANANVQGYSRQQAELATAKGQFSGAGFFGMGVDVTTISRAHSVFLSREATAAQSLAAMDASRLSLLRRMEGVFKTGEEGLGYAATHFLNGFSELATRPSDLALRQVVLARSGDLAARVADAGGALDSLQDSIKNELGAAIDEVNGIAQGMARINEQMVGLRSLGQPPNDLLDERDRLLTRLNTLVKVSTVDGSDGTTSVFVAGGQSLVLGARASSLRLGQDPVDSSRSALLLREGNADRQIGGNLLGGGAIAGLLRFQNEDLVDARNLVGRMAVAVGMAVNEQQALGTSLNSAPGEPPPPFFALGPARALAHTRNAPGPDGKPLAQVDLRITDPAAVKPSDYVLQEDADNPGLWSITRLVAGQPSRDPADTLRFDLGSLPDSEVSFQGMTLRFDNPPPQPGDRFTLQPASRAANGLRALIDDPRDIAAASSLVAVPASANSGTGSVAQLAFDRAGIPVPDASVRISFDNDAGAYSWELLDSGGGVIGGGSGQWVAGQPIPAPPDEINGFSLMLAGVPRSGDVFTVEPVPPDALASNNGNALLLTALRDGALADGRNLTDAWALALADVGVRVRSAATSTDISGAVARQAENARSSLSGVNMDEEAARLIQYQQSYQAAAKVLQVAQTLLDTVLQTTGR
jgi:flagellar hook-associated protein 1 FlgK